MAPAEAAVGRPAQQADSAPLTLCGALPVPVLVLVPLSVTLIHAAGPQQLHTMQLLLPANATAADALHASGLPDQLGAEGLCHLRLALWGRLCAPAATLQTGDRLSLLRPLVVDPMEARRRRLQRDGRPQPQRRSPRRG